MDMTTLWHHQTATATIHIYWRMLNYSGQFKTHTLVSNIMTFGANMIIVALLLTITNGEVDHLFLCGVSGLQKRRLRVGSNRSLIQSFLMKYLLLRYLGKFDFEGESTSC